MIEVDKKARSNKETQRLVSEYILGKHRAYKNSDCRAKLKSRMEVLNSQIDLASASNSHNRLSNTFQTKLVYTLSRETFNLRRASLKQNFRTPPLFTVSPDGGTPIEISNNMQEVLNANTKKTKFREREFQKIINSVSRWGVACSITRWDQRILEEKRTVADPLVGYARKTQQKLKANAVTTSINPLDYFQNPLIPSFFSSNYHGHVEQVFLSQLIKEVKLDSGLYIKENISKVIKEVKEHALESEYYSEMAERGEWDTLSVEKLNYRGVLCIKGNEDSDIIYNVEMVDDKIIRIQENPYDRNLNQYNIYTIDPRFNYWWGNTDVEPQIPINNYLSTVFNMNAESGLRSLKQLIFTGKGRIDPASIQRARNGGIVPVELKSNEKLNDLLFPWQARNIATGDMAYVTKELKEASDRVKPGVDFSRSSSSGGPQNKTLGGAMMMEQKGNMVEADYLEQFGFCLSELGEINMTLLMQFLPDIFRIRPESKMAPQDLEKWQILGDFYVSIENSMNKNQLAKASRLHNALTGMMNFKGTMSPEFQNLNIVPTIREWIRSLDLPSDVDETYPDTNGMTQQGMLPPQVSANPPQQQPQPGAMQ